MKGDAVNGARLKMTERIANANLVAQIVAELEPRQPVCTENFVRVDDVTKSLKLAG